MKKICSVILLTALSLTSCSNDDKSTVYNDSGASESVRLKADCQFENGPVMGYASHTLNGSYRFSWTPFLDGNPGLIYNARIEIRPNGTKCSITTAQETDIPINLITTSSSQAQYIKSGGFGGCFRWRIYYEGVSELGNTVNCSGATAWQNWN